MLGLDCGRDQTGIGNVLPEQDERISSSLDMVMRLLKRQYGDSTNCDGRLTFLA
jgi:hypothetical protein